MELEVTWERAFRVWWAYFWRSLIAIAASIVVGAVVGGILGFILGAAGVPTKTIPIVTAPVGFVVGLLFSVVPVKMILGKDFGEFRLLLVATQNGFIRMETTYVEDPDADAASMMGSSGKGTRATAAGQEPGKDPNWSKANDDLIESILLSNTHPQIAVDKIKSMLSAGVNLDARNESGRTALSIANYYEVPLVVKALLVSAGAKE